MSAAAARRSACRPLTNDELANTPYGRHWRLYYACEASYEEVQAVTAARMQAAADKPEEFFNRALGILRYLESTRAALHKMPGREFFNDPAEEFVGNLLHEVRQAILGAGAETKRIGGGG